MTEIDELYERIGRALLDAAEVDRDGGRPLLPNEQLDADDLLSLRQGKRLHQRIVKKPARRLNLTKGDSGRRALTLEDRLAARAADAREDDGLAASRHAAGNGERTRHLARGVGRDRGRARRPGVADGGEPRPGATMAP